MEKAVHIAPEVRMRKKINDYMRDRQYRTQKRAILTQAHQYAVQSTMAAYNNNTGTQRIYDNKPSTPNSYYPTNTNNFSSSQPIPYYKQDSGSTPSQRSDSVTSSNPFSSSAPWPSLPHPPSSRPSTSQRPVTAAKNRHIVQLYSKIPPLPSERYDPSSSPRSRPTSLDPTGKLIVSLHDSANFPHPDNRPSFPRHSHTPRPSTAPDISQSYPTDTNTDIDRLHIVLNDPDSGVMNSAHERFQSVDNKVKYLTKLNVVYDRPTSPSDFMQSCIARARHKPTSPRDNNSSTLIPTAPHLHTDDRAQYYLNMSDNDKRVAERTKMLERARIIREYRDTHTKQGSRFLEYYYDKADAMEKKQAKENIKYDWRNGAANNNGDNNNNGPGLIEALSSPTSPDPVTNSVQEPYNNVNTLDAANDIDEPIQQQQQNNNITEEKDDTVPTLPSHVLSNTQLFPREPTLPISSLEYSAPYDPTRPPVVTPMNWILRIRSDERALLQQLSQAEAQQYRYMYEMGKQRDQTQKQRIRKIQKQRREKAEWAGWRELHESVMRLKKKRTDITAKNEKLRQYNIMKIQKKVQSLNDIDRQMNEQINKIEEPQVRALFDRNNVNQQNNTVQDEDVGVVAAAEEAAVAASVLASHKNTMLQYTTQYHLNPRREERLQYQYNLPETYGPSKASRYRKASVVPIEATIAK